MELTFKIAVTALLTLAWLSGVRWVWTHQLDLRATVARFAEKAVAPPEWVATRDESKIYQDGAEVGEVSGPVQQNGDSIMFAQLSNTHGLNLDKPFEYKRLRVQAHHVESAYGMKVDLGKTLTNVFEGVQCQVIP